MIILGAHSMAKIEVIVNKMAVVFPVEYPRRRKLLFLRSLYTMMEFRTKKMEQGTKYTVKQWTQMRTWCMEVLM